MSKLEELEDIHVNRRWMSWDEEGWLISRVKELEGAIDRHRCSLNADHDKDYVGCRADKELYAHLAKPLADNDK